jgi:hypothetical protein
VPVLDEAAIQTAASLREQMQKHRENPACASCHSRMDPLGFGLENFNAIGAWRGEENGTPVDASGVLPDGQSFDGPLGLVDILRADRDSFAEAITGKMLTYALGRGLSRADRLAVRTITEKLAASDYKFSTLVLGIINSAPFQMRSEDQTTP